MNHVANMNMLKNPNEKRSFTVVSPSKVILCGEHAVVYGKLSIAASLALNTRMQFTIGNDISDIGIDFQDIGVQHHWSIQDVRNGVLDKRPNDLSSDEIDTKFLMAIEEFIDVSVKNRLVINALKCFFYLYSVVLGDDPVGLSIRVNSSIPVGAGLGSSAALAVCLSAGLLKLKNSSETKLDKEKICHLSLLPEKIIHGTPSGIDNAISTYGGIIGFMLGKIEPLVKVPDDLRILIIDTQVKRNTKELVTKVRSLRDQSPERINSTLDSINQVSHNCLDLLDKLSECGSDEDYQRLGDYLVKNQKLLEDLEVSHSTLEEICDIAKEHNLAAKLTGAGGGGFAFVLVPPKVKENEVEKIKKRFELSGFKCKDTKLGVQGVHIL